MFCRPELAIKEFMDLCENDLSIPNFQRDYKEGYKSWLIRYTEFSACGFFTSLFNLFKLNNYITMIIIVWLIVLIEELNYTITINYTLKLNLELKSYCYRAC